MGQVKHIPDYDGESGWTMFLPSRDSKRPIEGDVRADWAVLGAGFTGLAAARRLAEARPDDTIIVLDALEVGAGASGRNSGFAIDHAHMLGGGSAAAQSARGQKRLYATAIELLREIVETNGIECDWRNCGKFHAAASPRGVEKYLRPLLEELDHINEPHQWLTREEIREQVGIGHYEAAIYTPGTVLLNPAALVRGLAEALPENVTLAENSPVEEIEIGSSVTLTTTMGRVTAPRMIVATNAFLPSLGFGGSRLLPFVAYASLSCPLNSEEQAALGGRKTWGITPANAFVGPTIQRTGDHRILYRETITYRPRLRFSERELETIRTRHIKLFGERFPMLGQVTLDATWGGFLCLSRNQDSVFGQLGDNVWGAAGHQGIGITRGTISGLLAADMALGLNNPLMDDMLRISKPPANPPHPLVDLGIALRTAWEHWQEKDEA